MKSPKVTRWIASVVAFGSLATAGALPALADDFELDSGFSGNGYATAEGNLDLDGNAVFLDVRPSVSSVIAVGHTEASGRRVGLVAKYDSTGNLVTSFGGDGVVRLDLGSPKNTYITDVQTFGAFTYVAGYSTASGVNDVFLASFDVNGNLANSFGGGDGILEDDAGLCEETTGFARDATSGTLYVSGFHVVGGGCGSGERVSFVRRYTSNGSGLDTSYSSDGIVDLQGGAGDLASLRGGSGHGVSVFDLALVSGQVVLAGRGRLSGAGGRAVALLFRLDSSGNLDSTFSGDGYASFEYSSGTDQPDAFTSLAVSVTYILAGGTTGNEVFATRWNMSGVLDSTFATGGKTDLFSQAHEANSVELDSSGGVFLAAEGLDNTTFSSRAYLIRYTPSGGLDTDMGTSGVYQPFSTLTSPAIKALYWDVLSPRIVVVGSIDQMSMSSAGETLIGRLKVGSGVGDTPDDESVGEDAGGARVNANRRPPLRTFTLDPNGGVCQGFAEPWTISRRGSLALPTASECERSGFILAGWTRDASRTAPEHLLTEAIARSARLTAVWSPVDGASDADSPVIDSPVLQDLTGTAAGTFVGGVDRPTSEGGAVVDGYYIPPGTFA